MKITLQNIGIVKNSAIQLDGLTVITGKNNSGKTTVGKVVYSLIDAVSNIQNKARRDKLLYITRTIFNVENVLEFLRFMSGFEETEAKGLYADCIKINEIIQKFQNYDFKDKEIILQARKIYEILSYIKINSLTNDENFIKSYGKFYPGIENAENITKTLNDQIEKAKEILEKAFDAIEKDPELVDYTRAEVNQTLRVEFSEQIQPVLHSAEKSRIELTENGSAYFSFEIYDNKIVDDETPIYSSVPYKKSFFVDDPFVLDRTRDYRGMRTYGRVPTETFFDMNRISGHNIKLKSVLRCGVVPTAFEETILDDSLSKIKGLINNAIPGEFDFSSNEDFYIQNGHKLKTSNLATGSKMFAVLKLLIDNGELDESTMLILDEPEAHLHPSWQNKFAEVIVLLVKELNVNILLTTHSANFMLALDAYMRKYQISDKTNFYQTKYLEDGFVDYECVNNDLGKIYSDFMEYLSEVKNLRNEYI